MEASTSTMGPGYLFQYHVPPNTPAVSTRRILSGVGASFDLVYGVEEPGESAAKDQDRTLTLSPSWGLSICALKGSLTRSASAGDCASASSMYWALPSDRNRFADSSAYLLVSESMSGGRTWHAWLIVCCHLGDVWLLRVTESVCLQLFFPFVSMAMSTIV